jgi:alpha-glucosidase
MCLRGSLCLYQGEELGLPEAEIDFEELQDPYGIAFWPEFKGRDGARTPIPWVADNANAGFSDAKPWLPVKAPHLNRAVGAQVADAGSMLHHYRRALALRRARKTLQHGDLVDLVAAGDLASFLRRGDETIFCAFNLGAEQAHIRLPEGTWAAIGGDLGATAAIGGEVTLGAWGFCLMRQA